MKKLLILFLFILLSCEKREQYKPLIMETQTTQSETTESISIMSFNIQILGRSKSSKSDVMKIIVDIIDDYDLIAIQEVRDSTDQTLTTLMNMMPDYYKIIVGPREGRSSSKEQAIYLYDDRELDVIWSMNYNDMYDEFERSPFISYFQDDNKKIGFIIFNTHISPKSAKQEIFSLAKLMEKIYSLYEQEIISVGDFNADGSYYDEDILDDVFLDENYEIIIENNLNTTIGKKDNTYDRIIITSGLESKVIDSGVLYFEDYLINNIEPKQISDHYPIYMILEY